MTDLAKLRAMSKGDLVQELHSWDHCFISENGCRNFAIAFGVDPDTLPLIRGFSDASPDNPKGLTMAPGNEGAKGMAAHDLAEHFCRALKLQSGAAMFYGRGSQLRASCNALHAHFDALEGSDA